MIDEGRRLGKQSVCCVLRSSRAGRFERGKDRTKSVRGGGDLKRGLPFVCIGPSTPAQLCQHFVGPTFVTCKVMRSNFRS